VRADEIRDHWETQASTYGVAPDASWSDIRVMELEVAEIAGRLPEHGRVLDVGCANGWSTIQFASRCDIDVRGLDYVPQMVESARAQLELVSDTLRGKVEFDVGDMLDLQEADASYDAVVSIRVVINLGEWEQQVRGLSECVRVLKPGGVFLLSEATLQGWQRLNALRREWGLPDIAMPDFNNYLDEEKVLAELEEDCRLEELVNFASTYFVGTRVLKPLLAQAIAAPIDVANPQSELNRWFASLPAWGDYGTQKLFVLRKR
jgi:ubiquinone/menaquinone biosynthesis C-methylase UbiE